MDELHPLPRPQHPGAMPAAQELPETLPAYPGNISAYDYEMMLPPHLQAQRRRGASRLVRTILAVLIVLALIILCAMRLHTSDVQKATGRAEEFVIAMQSNQPDKAYAMGDDAFRKATTEQDLGAMFDKTEPFLRQSRLDQTEAYYATSDKGNPRTIVVFAATKGKQVTYVRLVMERQDDHSWKAHSLLTQSTPLQAKPE